MKGWKTITFNALAMVLPVLELTELRDVIPAQYLPWYALAVALGNVYLRTVTTTPVGRSK